MNNNIETIFDRQIDSQYTGFSNDGTGVPAAAFALTEEEIDHVLWGLALTSGRIHTESDKNMNSSLERRLLEGKNGIDTENYITEQTMKDHRRAERKVARKSALFDLGGKGKRV